MFVRYSHHQEEVFDEGTIFLRLYELTVALVAIDQGHCCGER